MADRSKPKAAAARKPKAVEKHAPGKRAPGKRAAGKRTPGRPLRDAQDLRPKLLDAAAACFVREGMASASLRAIATEAGVTPALLHYYFGDKAQLQEAFLQERMMPAFAIIGGAVQQAGDDVAATVAAFVNGVTEVVRQFPWWPQLWVREVLCEGGAMRDLLVDRIAPAIPRMMAERFAAAQAQGRLNPDLDPRLLVVSLVGLTMFPAAGAPIWQRIFDAGDLDAQALRAHTIALLDRGLECG